jgi:TPR repeat protein/c-di-GMP-related signal transduction protein
MFTFFAHLLRQRAPALPAPLAPLGVMAGVLEHAEDVQDLAVLRHAVLNRDKQVAGYEFLQTGTVGKDPSDPMHGHSFLTLLQSVLTGTGLGKRRAFAAFEAGLLFDPLLDQLARSGLVVLLRFDADADANDLTVFAERMQAMRTAGMRVGLADARLALAHPALGNAASLGFLPVDQISPADLLHAVRLLHSQQPQMQLFASGVRHQEEFEVCHRLKMHGFTGAFASHRRDWPSRAIDPGTANLCNLVTSLRAGAELDRIIRDIKRDPLISVRVLAYANSAGIGAQNKVQTLKDAILLIGLEPLFRWLVLLLCASGPSRQEDSALLENALVRGRMMELLAPQVAGAAPEDCFLTGVLSLLDVMLQQPAAALFETLDLPDAVRAALLTGEGPCASLLRLVLASEQQGNDGMQALCTECGITARQLSQAQAESLVWARGQVPGDAEEAAFTADPSTTLPSAEEPQHTAVVPTAALLAVFDAAHGGEPQAQCDLGARYATGNGVAQDWVESLAWYTRAAQQGNANAQWNVAAMHAHGQGCPEVDERQAFMWCQKAADQGFAAAQATLGLMYSTGQGAAKDLPRALVLLEQAALQGDVEAQYNLAVLQAKELGGEQNLKLALAWLSKAAEQGLLAAQERLGLMLAMGQAGEPDLIEAYKWFFIAHKGRDTETNANMEHSRTLMQPDQVQEAEQRARRWLQDRTAASSN